MFCPVHFTCQGTVKPVNPRSQHLGGNAHCKFHCLVAQQFYVVPRLEVIRQNRKMYHLQPFCTLYIYNYELKGLFMICILL